MTAFRLADRMSRLGTESAFEVLARAKAMEAAGTPVIHLEIGEPDFPTAGHITEAAVEALHAGHTHYVPAPGIPALREAVAAFLERTGRMRVSPDRVVVTPGAKPIMFFTILALAGPGTRCSIRTRASRCTSRSPRSRRPCRCRYRCGRATGSASTWPNSSG